LLTSAVPYLCSPIFASHADSQNNAFTGAVPIGLKKLKMLNEIDITGNQVERFSLAEARIALEKHLPHCLKKL